ncbi:hypothetical protein PC122_g10646 [Phytophthora cactorum]|nr:hypothetical protein PC122_g10646 [Phytophthora cactorum]
MLVTLACRVVHFESIIRFNLVGFPSSRDVLQSEYIYGNDKHTMQRMFDDIATKGRLQANVEQTGTSGIERKHFANLGWYSTSPIALPILCKSATGKHSPAEHSSAVPAS